MTIALGLLLGGGVFLVWWSFWVSPPRTRPKRESSLDRLIKRSGIRHISPRTVTVGSIALGLFVFLILTSLTRAVPIGLCFGFFASLAPFVALRWVATKRTTKLREVWPDVVDHLHSAVRAGLTLPEALSQLAHTGPEELRLHFADFASDYRAGTKFLDALERMKKRMGDPVADRLIASLRISHDVGGTDLGAVLESLSSFLREDARTRAELEARQSWTVNGARLAVIAPWAVLLLLATHQEAIVAYRSATGMVVLIIGMIVSLICYRLMRRIGQLPAERRVL